MPLTKSGEHLFPIDTAIDQLTVPFNSNWNNRQLGKSLTMFGKSYLSIKFYQRVIMFPSYTFTVWDLAWINSNNEYKYDETIIVLWESAASFSKMLITSPWYNTYIVLGTTVDWDQKQIHTNILPTIASQTDFDLLIAQPQQLVSHHLKSDLAQCTHHVKPSVAPDDNI